MSCAALNDLRDVWQSLRACKCCKTSLRSALTAAAAGSSPVVPAISFSITLRAILRFELARQSKVACEIPLCPIKTLNCKTCLSSMQASGLDDRVGTSSVAGVTVEQEPVRISACKVFLHEADSNRSIEEVVMRKWGGFLGLALFFLILTSAAFGQGGATGALSGVVQTVAPHIAVSGRTIG
jgi:hypothetical protein